MWFLKNKSIRIQFICVSFASMQGVNVLGNLYDIMNQNAKPASVASQICKRHGWFSVLIVDWTDAVNYLWHIDILAYHLISGGQ